MLQSSWRCFRSLSSTLALRSQKFYEIFGQKSLSFYRAVPSFFFNKNHKIFHMRYAALFQSGFCCGVVFVLLSGCLKTQFVRYNFSGTWVEDVTIRHKESKEKRVSIFPVYRDYLEGYLRGGISSPEGTPLVGVSVILTDEKGNPLENFTPGITDSKGIYKIYFSLPLIWNRIDMIANITVGDGWKITEPPTPFRFFYEGRKGILAFFPETFWLSATKDGLKTSEKKTRGTPEEPKENSSSFFGGGDSSSGFGDLFK